MNVTVAATSSDLIARMVLDLKFVLAHACLVDYAAHMDTDALQRLIDATAASYEAVQLNLADDTAYGRRDFVHTLALLAKGQSALVNTSTAVAFAFSPLARRTFITMAAASDAKLDALFAHTGTGRLSGLVLRDVYWGRALDVHAEIFLAAGRQPYIGSWHTTAGMMLQYYSLEFEPPRRPFLAVVADLARRNMLPAFEPCGKFFDPDPACPIAPDVRDGLEVARVLRLNPWRLRTCPHFGLAGVRDSPSNCTEILLACEYIILGLAALRLPLYIVLDIAQRLVDVGRFATAFVGNVARVYKKCAELQRKRIKNE